MTEQIAFYLTIGVIGALIGAVSCGAGTAFVAAAITARWFS